MSVLRSWLAWLLGVPPVDPGQGQAWRFVHRFPWPGWVLLVFAALAVLVVVGVYRQDGASLSRRARGLLAGLRLAALAVVLFCLSQAALQIERTELPYVVLLLDQSGSMATPDHYQETSLQMATRRLGGGTEQAPPTRLALAQALLTRNEGAWLARLRRRAKVRIYTFAEGLTWLGGADLVETADLPPLLLALQELQTAGTQTRPGAALKQVLQEFRGTPPSAVVVLSDGITTTTDADKLSVAAEVARSKGVPVYTVGIGNEEPLRDVSLFDTLVDEVAFADDPVTFSTKLKAPGFVGQKCEVVLKQQGGDQVLARKEITIQHDREPAKVELTFTPSQVGEFEYVVEAVALPREFRLDNNRETRHVSVRKEKLRVLLVDAVPRYEFRYLKHLLERDKTVELATLLQEADPEYAREDKTALTHFPVRKEELFRFDVVLWGDVNLAYLSPVALEQLRDFVSDQGGGWLSISGPLYNPLSYRGTPLEALLPFEMASVRVPPPETPLTEPFQPQLTVEGQKGTSVFRFAEEEADSLAIWNALPGFYWLVEAGELKPGAIPLAVHPLRTTSQGKLPVIVMQRFGNGKVVWHAMDETWRWRFRVGDLYFGRYWVQMVRYLARSRLLGKDRAAELTVDRSVYQRGEPVYLRVRFLDESQVPAGDQKLVVYVERAGDAQRRVELTRVPQAPNVFEGQLGQLPEGSYHAWVGQPVFSGAPPARDFRVESPLKEAQTLRMDATELTQSAQRTHGRYYFVTEAERLPDELPMGQPIPLTSDEPIRLWNHGLALGLFVGLLTCEWVLRKRWQLV